MVVMLVTVLPASAAGPFDGIWFANQLCSGAGSLGTFVVSVTENDATATFFGTTFNMVLFVLNPTTGTWTVDLGTRVNSTVNGQIFAPSGASLGVFSVTATSPTSFSGTGQILGVSCSLSGTRVF
jgi:hypothetical protein